MRFEYISGLNEEQLGELECRVTELLEEPWDKGEGRPHELTLRRHRSLRVDISDGHIIEDFWAGIFDVHQSTISGYITLLTPLIEKTTEEDRPTEKDAAEATMDAIALIDGTLWPCCPGTVRMSCGAGKYKTTEGYSKPLANWLKPV